MNRGERSACSPLPAEPPPRRSRWIWPFPGVAPETARFVDGIARRTASLSAGWRWLPAALVCGTVPLALSWALGAPGHQPASALLVFPLFVGLVRAAAPLRALATLAVAFLAHSAAVVLVSAIDPAGIAPLLPGAETFWAESLEWVQTGSNPEYEVSRWLPKHALLLGAVVALAYCSVGLTAILRGFYEVDLMNYYVGRLIAQSSDAGIALIYGWHVWSLVRGAGCALVVYEVSSISLAALTGRDPGAGAGRRLRLATGIALLLGDAALKLLLTDSFQARLQANLL